MYKKLNSLLTQHDRRFFLSLVLFSIFIAAVETVGVSIIMPFISVASDFSVIESNKIYHNIYTFLGFTSAVNFVVAFGIGLIIFYILRSILNLSYLHMLSRFTQGRTHLFAFRLFENYIGMPYHRFINNNSSDLTKKVINETHYLAVLMAAVLLIISETFVIIFIYIMMFLISWQITILMTVILFINAFFLIKTISKKIKKEGQKRESFQKSFYEIINSSFGNFKMIKLQSNEMHILHKFQEMSYGFTKSNITSETLSHFPRLFIETIGFGMIAFVIVFLVQTTQDDISNILGILSMFVVGLYRLMPSANRILSGYNQILYHYRSLDLIHNDLMYDIEKLGDKYISFQNNIHLHDVSFGYDEKKLILKNINLEIEKNDKIALIGPSGSGKSTLVDLIIGLYKPIDGTVEVDTSNIDETNIKSWRKKIGYIPQQVYLFDGTVADNISFGQLYNENKIKKVLTQAKILDFLESHQEGIFTKVGEGGIKLSGGQKQRIAIARALYGDPEILVLDEATSALDEIIEKEIMDEIYNLCQDKTLIIIAHRLSTIRECNKIYKIENQTLLEEKKEGK